jgi:hypothetical protein
MAQSSFQKLILNQQFPYLLGNSVPYFIHKSSLKCPSSLNKKYALNIAIKEEILTY